MCVSHVDGMRVYPDFLHFCRLKGLVEKNNKLHGEEEQLKEKVQDNENRIKKLTEDVANANRRYK